MHFIREGTYTSLIFVEKQTLLLTKGTINHLGLKQWRAIYFRQVPSCVRVRNLTQNSVKPICQCHSINKQRRFLLMPLRHHRNISPNVHTMSHWHPHHTFTNYVLVVHFNIIVMVSRMLSSNETSQTQYGTNLHTICHWARNWMTYVG